MTRRITKLLSSSALAAVLASTAFVATPAGALAADRRNNRDDHNRPQQVDRRDDGRDNRFDRNDDHRDNDSRNDRRDNDRDNRDVRVRVDERPAPAPVRATRVWVEPVYRSVETQQWVAPVYRTVNDRVWHPAVTRTECERVWVPDQYEGVPNPFNIAGPAQKVLKKKAHYEDRNREVVVKAGYYEDVCRQDLVCAGHYETVCTQQLVTAGHFEDRDDCAVATPAPSRDSVSFNFGWHF